jgi:hypothetical protein
VFIASKPTGGQSVAVMIHKDPMALDLLQRTLLEKVRFRRTSPHPIEAVEALALFAPMPDYLGIDRRRNFGEERKRLDASRREPCSISKPESERDLQSPRRLGRDWVAEEGRTQYPDVGDIIDVVQDIEGV